MIGGINKTTLIDFPGKIACVVYVAGCNMRCPYCHNKALAMKEVDAIPFSAIHTFLEKRRDVLEGVVFTGGEPTLDQNLPEMVRAVKNLGMSVKIDTNGTRPDVLKPLIDGQAIDYIAMDVKTSPEHYQTLTRADIDMDALQHAIDLIKTDAVDYEFRTTFGQPFSEPTDLERLGGMIRGAKRYVIQAYRPSPTEFDHPMFVPPTATRMEEIKNTMRHYAKNVIVRR